MFCSNCGNQLPDNTKFCNNCGAQLSANESAATAPKVTQKTTEKAAKKKPNIILILAIVLVAFLIGKFAIAPSLAPNSGDDPNTSNQGGQSQQETGNNSGTSTNTDNPAYAAIFDDSYIVHFQTFFNMEMANFAMQQDGGMIACADYGYKDDVVKKWVETVYIPVSGYTDSQKAEVETTFKTQFASIDALNCCTVAYKMSTNYFTITCTYSDVDKAENYGELYNAGVLQTNTFISMSATENVLTNQGFVKK